MLLVPCVSTKVRIGRQSMPDTPRAIRIPDDLWQAALDKAHANGDTLSDIVRRALERYVKR